MTTGSWDTMKKAKEDNYFEKKNQEAINRLKEKKESAEQKPRLSPISGEPMTQEIMHGVVIDRCPSSGGIWLDAGELEQLVEAMKNEDEANNWLTKFFSSFVSKS